jgi:hypothetical protein
MLRKISLVIALLAIVVPNFAATYTTIASGNWSNTNTWSGGNIPPNPFPAGNTLTISAGHTISITSNLSIGTTGGGAQAVMSVYGTVNGAFTITLGSKARVTVYPDGAIEVDNLTLNSANNQPLLTILSGGGVDVEILTNVNGTITNEGVIAAETITNNSTIVNDGEITTENYEGNLPSGGGTLPITLLSFKAWVNQRNVVELQWITALEINNDFFTLEKSTDMIEWVSIGTVSGAGNRNENLVYSFEDKNPYPGISYYRLKQTDYDGRYTYGPIQPLHFKTPDFVHQVYSSYQGQLSIQTANVEGSFQLEVLDLSGRIVYARSLQMEGASLQTINLPELSKSVYLLRVSSQQTGISQTLKFRL